MTSLANILEELRKTRREQLDSYIANQIDKLVTEINEKEQTIHDHFLNDPEQRTYKLDYKCIGFPEYLSSIKESGATFRYYKKLISDEIILKVKEQFNLTISYKGADWFVCFDIKK